MTEIVTEVGAGRETRIGDLALKSHERLFFERVPLPAEPARRIELSDQWRYAGLAEGVEAWGFRAMQASGEFLGRDRGRRAWFEQEYVPIVEVLREAGMTGAGPRPRPTCGSSACATCSCAPTHGTRRSSSGCARRSQAA